MTPEDKIIFRELAAFLAMHGYLQNGDYYAEEIPRLAYQMADMMMEERDRHPSAGLPPIRKRRRDK